jgi:hypothetical protein
VIEIPVGVDGGVGGGWRLGSWDLEELMRTGVTWAEFGKEVGDAGRFGDRLTDSVVRDLAGSLGAMREGKLKNFLG